MLIFNTHSGSKSVFKNSLNIMSFSWLFFFFCCCLFTNSNTRFADKRTSGAKTEHNGCDYTDNCTEYHNYVITDDHGVVEFHYDFDYDDDDTDDISTFQQYSRHINVLLSEDDQMSGQPVGVYC